MNKGAVLTIISAAFLGVIITGTALPEEYHHVSGCGICHDGHDSMFFLVADENKSCWQDSNNNQTIDPGETWTNQHNIRCEITVPNSSYDSANGNLRVVRFTDRSGADSFVDVGDGQRRQGVCQVCHTKTGHYRRDGSDNTVHFFPDSLGNDDNLCTDCHQHWRRFAPPPKAVHRTHLGSMRGPIGMKCEDCHQHKPPIRHNSSEPILFKDGRPLESTTACDGCHSPRGMYDGVELVRKSVNVGGVLAKVVDVGVYEEDGRSFRPGLEKWCLSCHDQDPSIVNDVKAPNVAYYWHDEAIQKKGWPEFAYGYEFTGHKISCLKCHDADKRHIDGEPRTYNVLELLGYAPVPYYDAYRLFSIDGFVPASSVVAPEFATFCYSCHNYDEVIVGMSYSDFESNGPKSEGRVNLHDKHVRSQSIASNVADSDYDGQYDAKPECRLCHNVHGAPNRRMIRGGELRGSATENVYDFGFEFITSSYKASCSYPVPPVPPGTFKVYYRSTLEPYKRDAATGDFIKDQNGHFQDDMSRQPVASVIGTTNFYPLALNAALNIDHIDTASGRRVTDTITVMQEQCSYATDGYGQECNRKPWVAVAGSYTFGDGDSITISTEQSGDYVVADAIGLVMGRDPDGDGVIDYSIDPTTGKPDYVIDDTDPGVQFDGNWFSEMDYSSYGGSAHFVSTLKADPMAKVKDSVGARFNTMRVGWDCANNCHFNARPYWERLPELYPRVLDREASPALLVVHDNAQARITARVKDHDDNIDKVNISAVLGAKSLTATMVDNGTGGDEKAGDDIFTALVPIDKSIRSGQYTFTIKAKDKKNLEGTNSIDLVVVRGLDRVVDNSQAEYSAVNINTGVKVEGAWRQQGAYANQFGSDGVRVYRKGSFPDVKATATWRPNLALPGRYRVSIWGDIFRPGRVIKDDSTALNAVTIGYKRGVAQPSLALGGCGGALNCFSVSNSDLASWVFAGEYEFDAGSSGYVSINDSFLSNGVSLVADAVLFEWVGGSAVVSGRIADSADVGVGGATVTVTSADGAQFSTKTLDDGSYEFTSGAGSYVVAPSKIGVDLTPLFISLTTTAGAKLVNNNFLARALAGAGESLPGADGLVVLGSSSGDASSGVDASSKAATNRADSANSESSGFCFVTTASTGATLDDIWLVAGALACSSLLSLLLQRRSKKICQAHFH